MGFWSNAWEGTKDVARDIPVLGDIAGLDSSADIAARKQRRALKESGEMLPGYYESGLQGYEGLAGLLGGAEGFQQRVEAGQYAPQYSPGGYGDFQYNLQEDPNYQFTRDQGLNAVQNMMAARGLTGSGREMQEMAKYASGLAGQYAPQMRQQAFNEHQRGFQNRMGEYGLAGQLGQQRYKQDLGVLGIGMQGLQGQTALQTALGGLQSGLIQQRGQVDAAQRMAQGNRTMGMVNQGIGLLGGMSGGGGAPSPGVSGMAGQQMEQEMQGYSPFSNSARGIAEQNMQGYRPNPSSGR